MRWSFVHTPPLPGPVNMAVDEALLHRARLTRHGVIRVYTWSTPTVSLGRNQTARGSFDPERLAQHGVAIVRRLTGGRAVLHHREVTYSVAAPSNEDGDLKSDCAAINLLLLQALRALGVEVTCAQRTKPMPRPGSGPCFSLPAPGELMFNDRKLVGSAQVREAGAYLQHGSILIHDDQRRLEQFVPGPVSTTAAATLVAALGREVAPGEFSARLRDAVRVTWDADVSDLDAAEIIGGSAMFLDRYQSQAWTWRR